MSQKILIVDDEPKICDNLAIYLKDEGLQVYTAQTGKEALHYIDTKLEVKTCVVDLRLPDMHGIEVIMAIRHQIPTMRFIIHTGSEDEIVNTILRSTDLNQLPIFHKPLVKIENLVQLLHKHSNNIWV